MQVPKSELDSRMLRFRGQMDVFNTQWEMVAIFSKINLYYFTGTMQEGVLIIQKEGDAIFWIRRSFERALDESLFGDVRFMNSFQDAAKHYRTMPSAVHIETEFVSLALLKRFQKYFPVKNIQPVDYPMAMVRAIKSTYELSIMEKAGKIHRLVLEDRVPELLTEGISEFEFAMQLYNILIEEGHQGLVRFGMFDTEMVLGHIAFGESSIYPTSFNGPGGNQGISPAIPFPGSRDRRLENGDLVFVDIGCGVDGYHTDKTMTYMFGKSISSEAIDAHQQCVAIQDQIAAMLKPGAIPSEIYETVFEGLSPSFIENFMGFGTRQVKFLGHGIGLTIDEIPVIARGFDEPIREGMVFALEPKKGIKGVGMVGIENTFLVSPSGGRCLTGTNQGLIPVF